MQNWIGARYIREVAANLQGMGHIAENSLTVQRSPGGIVRMAGPPSGCCRIVCPHVYPGH